VQQHSGADLEMLGPGLLAHVVAQAADTRYKYHPGRADTGHHLCVVAGTGRQPARGQVEVTRSRLHQRDDLGRKRDRLEACKASGRDRYAPIAGEPSKRAGSVTSSYDQEREIDLKKMHRGLPPGEISI
jgi:hypothetical protein